MSPPPGSTLGGGSGGLSREVLKWLQSLDLSYAVKDVKRDFSNGFLVAEIFSRFFPGEVQLHSFDNGLKLATKNDNWEQLYKFFRKKGMPIGKNDFDPVLHCVPGAPGILLTKIYKLLTKREVPYFPETQLQPTREIASPAEGATRAITSAGDRTGNQAQLGMSGGFGGSAMQGYGAGGGADGFAELSLHTMARGGGRAQESRGVSQSVDIAPLEIKEVQMKPVRSNVTQLRAQSDMQQSHRSRAGTSASGRHSAESPTNQFGVVKPAVDILKTIILPVLQEFPDVQSRIDVAGKDLVSGFLELCFSLTVPEQASVRAFEAIGNRAPLIAEGLLKAPTEFWKVWTLLRPGLVAYEETSPNFEALLFCLTRLGEAMRDSDATMLLTCFLEIMLPQLAELLTSAGKREQLCDLIQAYCAPTSHLQLLRALKKHIPDLSVYILCLSYLCRAEGLAQVMDEFLLDLYVYYAMMALHSPVPRVRVAGLVILGNLAVAGGAASSAVWPLVPELQALVHDRWWEVQAQLVLLAATMIRSARQLEESPPEGSVDALLAIIQRLFRPNQSKNLLQVGLVGLARCLRDVPALVPTFVTVLLAQPTALRQRLLRSAGGAATRVAYVMGPSSRLYEERGVGDALPKLAVATEVLTQAQEAQGERLDAEHCDVIAACVGTLNNASDEEAEEWLAFYDSAKAFLVVAVLDADLHATACTILRAFYTSPIAQSCLAVSVATFVQSLRLLYSAGEKAMVPEEQVIAFLRGLKETGEEQDRFVSQVLSEFKTAHAAEYGKSSLAALAA